MSYIIHSCFVVFITLVISVTFTQDEFSGTEAAGFVKVDLEYMGAIAVNPFSVIVNASEQSPVSAEGNSAMCVSLCNY